MADQRDLELRRAALEQVRELQRRYDDLIPLSALSEGFVFAGRRISFGSFFSGIFPAKEMNAPAALCVVTAPPKHNDQLRTRTNSITEHEPSGSGSVGYVEGQMSL